METRVRISVGDIEVEAVGEEQFVVDRLPNLLSDLLSRLACDHVPTNSPPSAPAAHPVGAKLASIAGDVRDYWADAPVAGVEVTTIGLEPNLVSRSDQAGRFVMSGRSAGERCSLVTSGLEAYVETIVPVELSTGPTTLTAVAVARSDINRQFASLGVTRESDTGIVIIDLLDANGAPLEMVPASDITLTAANGLVVGSGPYFFGASGDLQPQADLPISRAFAKRARAAFINVPTGDHTIQITAVGAGDTLARAILAVPAISGATMLQAKLPT